MTISSADKFTILTNNPVVYSDFLINFDKNPITGYLAVAKNEQAIKSSIRNLIMTERTERHYNSSIGCKVRSLLFDPLDDVTGSLIEQTIRETINNNEPRVNLISVKAETDYNSHGYHITILFEIINIPSTSFDIKLFLTKVR